MHLYSCSVSGPGSHIVCRCPLRGSAKLQRVRGEPRVLGCPLSPDESVSALVTGRTFRKESSLDGGQFCHD